MRVGAFIGKFYPPHIGHLSVIDKVVNKVDELVIYLVIGYIFVSTPIYILLTYLKLKNELK